MQEEKFLRVFDQPRELQLTTIRVERDVCKICMNMILWIVYIVILRLY